MPTQEPFWSKWCSILTGNIVLDISVDQLRDLNPQYVKDIYSGVKRPYISVSFEYSGEFAALQDSIFSFKDSVYFNRSSWIHVPSQPILKLPTGFRSGQTLSHIAYRYGVRIADIKCWNGLRSDRIMPNQRLIIYTDRNAAPRASSQNSGTAAAQGNLITHTVRRGETLGGIAEKYGVSAANIRSWNNMRSSTIYAGGTLKIYTSATLATSHDGDFEYYTVKSGDNLWDIANKLGITVQNIRSLNGWEAVPEFIRGKSWRSGKCNLGRIYIYPALCGENRNAVW